MIMYQSGIYWSNTHKMNTYICVTQVYVRAHVNIQL